MTFRIAQQGEQPTHVAYNQFSPEQGALPLLVLFKIIGLHGCPAICSDADYLTILGLCPTGQPGGHKVFLVEEEGA